VLARRMRTPVVVVCVFASSPPPIGWGRDSKSWPRPRPKAGFRTRPESGFDRRRSNAELFTVLTSRSPPATPFAPACVSRANRLYFWHVFLRHLLIAGVVSFAPPAQGSF
jgi:hypothetical protein